jgi:hypothetical protein
MPLDKAQQKFYKVPRPHLSCKDLKPPKQQAVLMSFSPIDSNLEIPTFLYPTVWAEAVDNSSESYLIIDFTVAFINGAGAELGNYR